MTKRAAIYVRVSRDEGDDGKDSVAGQAKRCRALAKAKGYKVVGEPYVDPGVSGEKDWNERPEFRRMLADGQAREFDVIIFDRFDRLTRRGIFGSAPMLQALKDAGLELLSVNDPVDTTSPAGDLILSILLWAADYERQKVSERTLAGKAITAPQGRYPGGPRRFGYTEVKKGDKKPPTIIKAEADLLHEAADRLLGGESLGSIVKDWNARGIKTSRGNKWTGSTLGATLRSPFLAGIRVHHGERHPGQWPAIFSEDLHRRLVESEGYQPPVTTPRHLLTGLVRCGLCEHGMTFKRSPRGAEQYACRGCKRLAMNAAHLEGYMSELVEGALQDDALRDALRAGDIRADRDALVAALDANREALHLLNDDFYQAKLIERDEFKRQHAALRRSITEAEDTLARIDASATTAITEDPVELWTSGDMSARRQVVQSLISSIVVGPATHRRHAVDKDRVAVTLRG